MSTLHKFKAYFGMVPFEDFEDDYVDDRAPRGIAEGSVHRTRDFADRSEYGLDRYDGDFGYKPAYQSSYPPQLRDDFPGEPFVEDRWDGPRRPTRIDSARIDSAGLGRSRSGPSLARGVTRGALAVDPDVEERLLEQRVRPEPAPQRRPAIFEDGGPLSKITTLRPRDYSEAAVIGERFREGNPVIMDLVDLSNADAKRLVDFAAGLAFALRGSFDKVATKVFLLSPADVDVSAEERRRIAETGFYNHTQ